ncbi:hypothetical protein [Thiospirillum jenense]|uniref:Uncharacterized protein n=1 Tax=Thiospirillum jenense TaxID=1653858 RepID=A0A839HCZ9_9GAMM|nr:hypothetical protein [Thiospirillum jenense]MBB1124909.1 hypothetical protein [Thiospirillum jenense]
MAWSNGQQWPASSGSDRSPSTTDSISIQRVGNCPAAWGVGAVSWWAVAGPASSILFG